MKDDQKNFLLFAVLAAAILFGWPTIASWVFPTQAPAPVVASEQSPAAPASTAGAPTVAGAVIRDLDTVLKESPRVTIDTPSLKGSINLKGARIDDLILVNYLETIEENAAPIRLLSPVGTKDAYFASFGWREEGLKAPTAETVWEASAQTLTPTQPVTLTARNDAGQIFRIELAIDEKFMFSVKQTVANFGSNDVSVAPFGLVYRSALPAEPDSWTVHVGPMTVNNAKANYDIDYDDLEGGKSSDFSSRGAWLGFTEKYWLAALIPDQSATVAGKFRGAPNGGFQADFSRGAQTLVAGREISHTSNFFAGAKETALIDGYEADGITLFGKAIDWGWFELIEKPIFYYLDWLFRLTTNFGVAIILLTVTIRAILFPIANKQFKSMAAMRVLQPKMKALQEKYKDDKQRQQQEIMKLYKEEKVNPLAGCLPILIQIPIMYALYKVLMLTIEMRHQPFVLWIHDLSAPDPATFLNLFGLLDFTVPSFLAIGVFPLLLGLSMYFQFKLNPQPMDDIQKQIFSIMPWMLMFVMAPFAVGLQLYWITSNILTIAQQKFLYSRHPGLKEPLLKKEPKTK